MPIYEYICKDCNRRFEALVHGSQQATCPNCNGSQLDQQFSTYAVSSSTKSATPSPCGGGACGFGNGGGCGFDS